MKYGTDQAVIQIVEKGNQQVMQKFLDEYLSGNEKFGEPDYEYSAATLGKIIVNRVKELSKTIGFTNQVLASREVKPGEVIRFDKDPHIVAYTLDEDGDNIKDIGCSKYVYPPEVEISFAVKFSDYKSAKTGEEFIEKLTNDALIQLVAIQDNMLFKLLNRITNANHTIIDNNFEDMFSDLIKEIEQKRIPAGFILLNRETNNKFVKQIVDSDKTDWIDPTIAVELVKAGHVGVYKHWGHSTILTRPNIIDEDIISKKSVYVTAPPEYLGGAPIRVDLMTEPVRQEKEPIEGLYFYKLMSMVIINPFAVVRGELNDYCLTSLKSTENE